MTFSKSTSESDFEKLPTLTQYLKKVPKKQKLPDLYIVTKIWYPNNYPNFSLETEYFMVRVKEDTQLGTELLQYWDQMEEEEWCLALRVTNRSFAEFELVNHETERCTWEDLGRYGRKLTIQEKKKTPSRMSKARDKKRDSRKPDATADSLQDDQEEASA